MLQRFLLIWLLLGSITALFWPQTGIAFDPFLAIGGSGIQWLLVVIMFCIGMLLPATEVNALALRWPTVVVGTAVQYISMPLLAWCCVQYFKPDPATAAGVMIVGCVPGAMASNVLTLAARGNVSYSVSLTTSATLLSPLIVPIILRLTIADNIDYDGGQAVRLFVLRVVAPVIIGHCLRRFIPDLSEGFLSSSGMIANLAILAVISIAVALQRDRLTDIGASLLGMLALINLMGYAFGYLGGAGLRFPEAMRRALTLEVGMQNAGAGTALAIQLFGEESAAITPCILYTFGCMFTGTLLATVWNSFPPVSTTEGANQE